MLKRIFALVNKATPKREQLAPIPRHRWGICSHSPEQLVTDALRYHSMAYDQNDENGQNLDLAKDLYMRTKDIDATYALDLIDRKDGIFDQPKFYDFIYKEFQQALPNDVRTIMIGYLLCFSAYSNASKKIFSETNMFLLDSMVSD